MRCPDLPALSSRFGFPVAGSYQRLLELAFRLNPGNPWHALEPVDLYSLGTTRADPDFTYPGHDYADTPVELHVFAWAGTDGGHYGFVVDEVPDHHVELPVAECYPGSPCRVVGMSLPDCLSWLIAAIGESEEDPHDSFSEIASMIVQEFDLLCEIDADSLLAETHRRRMLSAVPTEDGCGVVLPEDSVDRAYLGSVDWCSSSARPAAPDHLIEAHRRLQTGEPGTALVLARNVRHHHWYDDWKTGRRIIRRTAELMEEAYTALGRNHLSERIRAQTEWALEAVR